MASPYGNGANPVGNLLLTAATDDDAEIDQQTIAGLIPNNTGGTSGGTLPDPVQAGTDFNNAANTADDTLDQANADAEDDRVTAVTGVRDGLDTALETADVTWGGTMDSAGAALGSALDGIQDFDWQHVRNYVGAVTGARRAAELGALSAQVGFVTSYTGAVNNYTASIATAAVTHTTLYAQATADYYVDTADQEALAAESAVTTAIAGGASQSEIDTLTATATAKRAKATAFATFATSYVTHLTTQAQSAATTAVTSVSSANATALATITTEVATATTDITTFYDDQITGAANPPPVDTDLNNDGIPDPPTPTATQSITTSINAAKTANTTARTTVSGSFADLTNRRETGVTNSFAVQPTSDPNGGNTGGSNGNIPTAFQSGVTPPPAPGTPAPGQQQQQPAPFHPASQFEVILVQDPDQPGTGVIQSPTRSSPMPVKYGNWVSGVRGNGIWEFDSSPRNVISNIVGGQVVFVNNRIPVGGIMEKYYFGGNAELARLNGLELTGDRPTNFAIAKAAMAEKMAKLGYTWEGTPDGKMKWTWHEVNRTTMELVQRRIHAPISHAGAISDIKNSPTVTLHSIGAPPGLEKLIRENKGAFKMAFIFSAIDGIGKAVDKLAWELAAESVTDDSTSPEDALSHIAFMRSLVNRPRGVIYAFTNVNNPNRDKDLNAVNAWLDEMELFWQLMTLPASPDPITIPTESP